MSHRDAMWNLYSTEMALRWRLLFLPGDDGATNSGAPTASILCDNIFYLVWPHHSYGEAAWFDTCFWYGLAFSIMLGLISTLHHIVQFVFILGYIGIMWGDHTQRSCPPWPRFEPRLSQLDVLRSIAYLSHLLPITYYLLPLTYLTYLLLKPQGLAGLVKWRKCGLIPLCLCIAYCVIQSSSKI